MIFHDIAYRKLPDGTKLLLLLISFNFRTSASINGEILPGWFDRYHL